MTDPFEDLDDDSADDSPAQPDRFDDLGDHLDAALSADASAPDHDRGQESDVGAPDPKATPAFSFDATRQIPVYPRAETVDAVRDFVDLDVVAELRRAGLEEVETREAHEAMLTVAMDNDAAVRRRVLEQRGLDPCGPG
jgi:hypothetical protein